MSYSQREIRYGARLALTAVPNWASSGHLRRCSDPYTSNKYLSREKDASILPYHGKLSWVTRSSGLPYSQREIRYGARVVIVFVPNWASSGHLRRRSDSDTTNKYLSREKDASIYHGKLSWVTISSGLPYSQREIRYGCN